jgi:hypothetical protein
MKPKKRQKMCYNCEGDVDLEVIVCPFCAADLREEKPEQQRPIYNPTASVKNLNTQQSLYPPKHTEEPTPGEPVALAVEEEEPKNVFGPLILLTLGAQLLLLGLFMLLFSHHGMMTLKWDARFWFIYLFASVPLLIFGYRALSKL